MDAQKSIMNFHDIASGPPIRPFAPNPWKALYTLNFTNTPYCTIWVPLPDVAATRKKLGVPACRKHADGTGVLNPILYDPITTSSTQQQGTFFGDSFDIAIHPYTKHSSPDGGRPLLFPPNRLALHRTFNAPVGALFSLNGALFAGHHMPLDPASAGLRLGSVTLGSPGTLSRIRRAWIDTEKKMHSWLRKFHSKFKQVFDGIRNRQRVEDLQVIS